MSTYGLAMYSAPSSALPLNSDSVSYTYVFEIVLPSSSVSAEYFLQLAQDMIENDGDFIHNAEPNVVNFRSNKQHIDPIDIEPRPLSEDHVCPTNDTYYAEMNHIENVGTNVPFGFQYAGMPNGVSGADAHICECWSQGYHGTGIKVGVIGSQEFNLNHSDMVGRFDPNLYWDCSSGICVPLVSNDTVLGISGMRIAGLIAANANNNEGAVGVAPETVIVPYKIGEDYTSTVSLAKAIEQALADQVDVLVTDFFSPINSGAVQAEMLKHFQLGRASQNPSSDPLGTVLIAPAGFTTDSVGSTANFYPAASVLFDNDVVYEPISVIGSNRFDELCTLEIHPTQSSWTYAVPSHYGNQYDVAAPGPRLIAPTGMPLPNVSTYRWDERPHTGAVATVAGIAAMLLEKDPTQTAMEVRTRIIQGADQVGGYAYPGGISMELGHGRVNCGNSLNLITTSISPQREVQPLEVAYLPDRWRVSYDQLTRGGWIQLCNLMGQVLESKNLMSVQPTTDWSHTHLAPGLYLLQLRDGQGHLLGSQKVVKY